jgi:hypothetical protein
VKELDKGEGGMPFTDKMKIKTKGILSIGSLTEKK